MNTIKIGREAITVATMGEDGDTWLVTGTSDAHSADEAVRQHVELECGETLEALIDAEDLVELDLDFRNNWVWKSGNPEPEEDDALLTFEQHFEHYSHESKRIYPFAGFLVRAV